MNYAQINCSQFLFFSVADLDIIPRNAVFCIQPFFKMTFLMDVREKKNVMFTIRQKQTLKHKETEMNI